MFIDYQNVTCYLGLNFMGNLFVASEYKMIHCFVIYSGGYKFVDKSFRVTHNIFNIDPPTNNDDSTILFFLRSLVFQKIDM